MLNRQNFEIADLASEDEDRISLCGILVSPTGTAVTDGRMAMAVSSVEDNAPSLFANFEGVEVAESFTPFILDKESALRISKAIPKGDSEVPEAKYAVIDAESENGDTAVISVNDIFRQDIMRVKKISGNFPDIDRVMPDPEKASFTIAFNPDLLADVLKTVARFCKNAASTSITMRVFSEREGIRIDAASLTQTLRAVVMPLRIDANEEKKA
jgi:hypothetical protein